MFMGEEYNYGSPFVKNCASLTVVNRGYKLPKMKYGQRLKKARTDAGFTQSGLVSAINNACTQENISKLERGNATGSEYTTVLAKACGVSPVWLATGEGGAHEVREQSQLYHAPPIGGKVPLVSWVQAGSMMEVEDPHAPGVAEDWITTTVQVRDHTFALRVRGDSMEPEFPDGMIIIIEPDMQYENGDFVVVRNTNDEATFKQLVQDGSDWYLKPVNPRYPIKPLGDAEIVGVVREAVKKYR